MSYEHLVLGWLARVPLQNPDGLAAVAGGLNIVAVRRTLNTLRESGWLLRLPDGHGLAAGMDQGSTGPRYAVSAAGLARIAAGASAPGLLGPLSPWDCSLRSTAAALCSAPVAFTANAVLAELAGAIQREGAGQIAHAAFRALPRHHAARHGDPRAPLRFGHAELRWRAGPRETRLALHIDRPGMPRALRAAQLSEWRRLMRERGPERQAALLVVCDGWSGVRQWEALWRRAATRHGRTSMPYMAFGRAEDVTAPYDLEAPVWFRPAAVTGAHRLLAAARWMREESPERFEAGPSAAAASAPAALPRLAAPGAARAAFSAAARAGDPYAAAAAAALALDGWQWRILSMLASQPWLRASDIAAVQGIAEDVARRQLVSMGATELVVSCTDDQGDPVWLLGERGALLAAARSGALSFPARFRRFSSIRAAAPGELLHPGRHASGVSRSAGLLAAAARAAGLRPAAWIDERWWRREVGRAAPIPDGVLRLGDSAGEPLPSLLIEYERVQQMGEYGDRKVGQWIEWYRAERWRGMFASPPLLLFIVGRDADEARTAGLWRAIARAPLWLPAFGVDEAMLVEHGFRDSWHAAGGVKSDLLAALLGASPA